MGEATRVVARFGDGKVLKGTTQDFFPNRPSFHLLPADGGASIEIRCKQLKALFFVKTFEGDRQRKDVRGFVTAPAETAQGKKIAVRFKDAEVICGYSLSYTPDREGFFIFPADGGSNNLRIYVVTASTTEVKAGPAAEAMAQRLLGADA
ncbi:MAG TPA: hypothetical protein VFQ05_08880 [Candidatus Eisenbacteria bacterium]|nr:hypothetical protein [Candidatus Eisenbacteria bacterium]